MRATKKASLIFLKISNEKNVSLYSRIRNVFKITGKLVVDKKNKTNEKKINNQKIFDIIINLSN